MLYCFFSISPEASAPGGASPPLSRAVTTASAAGAGGVAAGPHGIPPQRCGGAAACLSLAEACVGVEWEAGSLGSVLPGAGASVGDLAMPAAPRRGSPGLPRQAMDDAPMGRALGPLPAP